MTIKQNLLPSNPDLQDVLNLFKREIFLSLNVHHLGTIDAFDSATQTATVTINYKKTYFERQSNGVYIPKYESYPILLDCPCIVLGGGPAALTMPIQKGDECLVLFNDRDIDNWFQNGQVAPVATARLHSISDGIALVGLRSLSKVLSGYDSSRAILQYGETKVGVGEEKVLIRNTVETLNQIMSNFIDVLTALTTTNAVVGVPCAVSAASITQLNAIKTRLAALLE